MMLFKAGAPCPSRGNGVIVVWEKTSRRRFGISHHSYDHDRAIGREAFVCMTVWGRPYAGIHNSCKCPQLIARNRWPVLHLQQFVSNSFNQGDFALIAHLVFFLLSQG